MTDITNLVLRLLVAQWLARAPKLSEYLAVNFRHTLAQPIEFRRLYIAHTDGTVQPENIGGVFRAKWVIEDGILASVPLDYHCDRMYVRDATGRGYLSPSWLFCYQDERVLLSERYGPELKHRLLGQVETYQPPVITWRTLWKD